MAEPAQEIKEESMENILKSIKNIISGNKTDTPANVAEATPSAAASEEPLVLTDKIGEPEKLQEAATSNKNQEDTSTIELSRPAVSSPGANDVLSNIDQALGAEPTPPPPPPQVEAVPVQEAQKPETQFEAKASEPMSAEKNNTTEQLIKNDTAKTSMESVKNLMNAIPKPKLDSPSLRSGQTLEDLVVESLKPMMSDWLNKNLPVIVQQIVEKEIRKIIPKE